MMFHCSLYKQSSPLRVPSSKQAHKRLVDRRRAGAPPKMPLQGKTVGSLNEGRPSVRSVFSSSPQGPKPGILMPQSTQSHARPSCMVSMMDRLLQRGEKNNAGFIITEVGVITVSTKQMSLTLECSKSRFTTSALQVTTPHNKHQTDR